VCRGSFTQIINRHYCASAAVLELSITRDRNRRKPKWISLMRDRFRKSRNFAWKCYSLIAGIQLRQERALCAFAWLKVYEKHSALPSESQPSPHPLSPYFPRAYVPVIASSYGAFYQREFCNRDVVDARLISRLINNLQIVLFPGLFIHRAHPLTLTHTQFFVILFVNFKI